MIYLVLLFIILFGYLALRRLDWAITIVIFALPSYLIRFKIAGVPSTLLEVMILIVFAAWVYANFFRLKTNLTNIIKRPFGMIKIPYPFQWEMILLLIVSLAAVGVSMFSSTALGIWKAYFVEPILLYMVVVNVFGRDANNANSMRMARIIWPLVLSSLLISLLAIYQKITGNLIDNPFWSADAQRRAVSVFGYPNAVGLYLAPLVMLFLGWLISSLKVRNFTLESGIRNIHSTGSGQAESGNPNNLPIPNSQFPISKSWLMRLNWTVILIGLIIIVSLLAILFAKSVGAALGLAAGALIFALLAGKKSRIAIVIIVVVAAAVTFTVPQARAKAIERLTLQDFSGQVRKILWQETWQMLSHSRLIFGAGLANYQAAVKPYHLDGFFYNKDHDPNFHRKVVFDQEYKAKHWQPLEVYLYPHNIFLNFWSELGLAGMLLFIWIMGRFIYMGVKMVWNLENKKWKQEVGNRNQELGIRNFGVEMVEKDTPPNSQFPIPNSLSFPDPKFLIIGLTSSMVVILFHGLVDVPYFKNDLSIIFWIFLAMMSIFHLRTNNEKFNSKERE